MPRRLDFKDQVKLFEPQSNFTIPSITNPGKGPGTRDNFYITTHSGSNVPGTERENHVYQMSAKDPFYTFKMAAVLNAVDPVNLKDLNSSTLGSAETPVLTQRDPEQQQAVIDQARGPINVAQDVRVQAPPQLNGQQPMQLENQQRLMDFLNAGDYGENVQGDRVAFNLNQAGGGLGFQNPQVADGQSTQISIQALTQQQLAGVHRGMPDHHPMYGNAHRQLINPIRNHGSPYQFVPANQLQPYRNQIEADMMGLQNFHQILPAELRNNNAVRLANHDNQFSLRVNNPFLNIPVAQQAQMLNEDSMLDLNRLRLNYPGQPFVNAQQFVHVPFINGPHGQREYQQLEIQQYPDFFNDYGNVRQFLHGARQQLAYNQNEIDEVQGLGIVPPERSSRVLGPINQNFNHDNLARHYPSTSLNKYQVMHGNQLLGEISYPGWVNASNNKHYANSLNDFIEGHVDLMNWQSQDYRRIQYDIAAGYREMYDGMMQGQLMADARDLHTKHDLIQHYTNWRPPPLNAQKLSLARGNGNVTQLSQLGYDVAIMDKFNVSDEVIEEHVNLLREFLTQGDPFRRVPSVQAIDNLFKAQNFDIRRIYREIGENIRRLNGGYQDDTRMHYDLLTLRLLGELKGSIKTHFN